LSRKCVTQLSLISGWKEIQIVRFNHFVAEPGAVFNCREGAPAFDRDRPYVRIQKVITSLSESEIEDLKRDVDNLFNLADIHPGNRAEYLYFLHRCLILQLTTYYGNYIDEDMYLCLKKIMLETPWDFASLPEWKKNINDFIIYLNLLRKKQRAHHSFVDDALLWIHEHFTEDISMTRAANQVSVNYTYFSEKFKEQTGCHFNEYISRLRINAARMMLETGYYNVSEVAARCGFKDEKYFGKIFKNLIGASPGEYRRKNSY
jgi:two-component system response regulator YesN